MKITLLEVFGYRGVLKARIEPGERSFLLIGGKNAQGKTSLLGAIQAALGGAKEIPADPVHHGEPYAEIRVELEGDAGALKVERRISPDGKTKLVIEDADGKKQRRAQSMLDDLLGARFLDPLQFLRLKPREQAETLLEFVDLDLDVFEHDAARRLLYTERSGFNEDVKRLKVQRSEKEDSEPIPDEIDPSVLTHELTRLIESTAEQRAELADLELVVESREKCEAAIEARELELAELRGQLPGHLEAETTLTAAIANHVPLAELEKRRATAEDKVATAGALNAERAVLLEQRRVRGKLKDELRDAERSAARLTAKIKAMDAKKSKALASADLPVEGLGFDESGVTYNGVPLEQASGAERLRVSLGLACAMSAELRDICITDGALLDADSLRLVSEYAEAHDLRVWLERVGESDDGAIIIREGEIVQKVSE